MSDLPPSTRCCYYNTDCGSGSAWLREANSKPTPDQNPVYYSSEDIAGVSISVATADEEDGEPSGHFTFAMRVKNVPAKLSDRIFDVDVEAFFTRDELKRLHAVFGLLLGLE